MKGFQLGLKPQRTLEEFTAAAASTILSDAFFNVYETTGPGMGDDKP
ncbi:hypothetical protein ACCS70_35620 [Rhizobium ruizarguesonis]|nr:hypothetical protein [Rhizobium ruizarguesonis]NEJ01785.1 hypothetical protein [Rhizobium ruizarguesonis]NEJ38896.1 hypothetical protein [Rhizobium ruizarguesonis]UED32601.1 hypothetical protein BSO17_06240 [Rhizobium ruizarguesonis]